MVCEVTHKLVKTSASCATPQAVKYGIVEIDISQYEREHETDAYPFIAAAITTGKARYRAAALSR